MLAEQVEGDLRVVGLVRPAHGVAGALGCQQEDRDTGETGRHEGEVVLGDLVDPLEIFQNQHMEPSLSPDQGQRPDRLERLLSLVLRVQMLERLVRAGEAEYIQ